MAGQISVADLVVQMHDNMDSIHKCVQSLSDTSAHDAEMERLEMEREAKIQEMNTNHENNTKELAARQEKERIEVEQRIKKEEEEIMERRRKEDEERRLRIQTEEEKRTRLKKDIDDLMKNELAQSQQKLQQEVEEQMEQLEDEMERQVEEGKKKLADLDEKRRAINAQIELALNKPTVLPVIQYRSRAKTRGSARASPITPNFAHRPSVPTNGASSSSNGDGSIPRVMNGIETNGTSTNGTNGTKLDSPEVSAAAPKVQDDAETVPAARSLKEDEVSSPIAKPEVEFVPKENEGSIGEKGLDVGDDLDKVGLEEAQNLLLSKSVSSPAEEKREEDQHVVERAIESKETTSPSAEKNNALESLVGAEKVIEKDDEPEIHMTAKGLGFPANEGDVVVEDKPDLLDSTIPQSETHPVEINNTTEDTIEGPTLEDAEPEVLEKALEKAQSKKSSEHLIEDPTTKEISVQDENKQEQTDVETSSPKELDEKVQHDGMENPSTDITAKDDLHSDAAIKSDSQSESENASETILTDNVPSKQVDDQDRSLASDEANEKSELVPKSLDSTDEFPKEHTPELDAKQSETVPESSNLPEEDNTPSTNLKHSEATLTGEKEPQESGSHEEPAGSEKSIDPVTKDEEPITIKSLDVNESVPSTTEENEHVTLKSPDVGEKPALAKSDDLDDEEIPADWMPRNLDELPAKKVVAVNTPQETTSPIHVAEASSGILEGFNEEVAFKDDETEPEEEIEVKNLDAAPELGVVDQQEGQSSKEGEEAEIAVKNLDILPEPVESSKEDEPEPQIEIKNLDALLGTDGDSKDKELEAETEIKNLDALPEPIDSSKDVDSEPEIEIKNLDAVSGPVESSREVEKEGPKEEDSEVEMAVRNLDAVTDEVESSHFDKDEEPKNEEPEVEFRIKNLDVQPEQEDDSKDEEPAVEIEVTNLDILPVPVENSDHTKTKDEESDVEIEIKNLDALPEPIESSHLVEEKESKNEEPELDIKPRDLDAITEPIADSHHDEGQSKQAEAEIGIKNVDAVPEAVETISHQLEGKETKDDEPEFEIQPRDLDAALEPIVDSYHVAKESDVLEAEEPEAEIEIKNLDALPESSHQADEQEPKDESEAETVASALPGHIKTLPNFEEKEPKDEEQDLDIQPRNLDEVAQHHGSANQEEAELEIQPKDLDSSLEHSSTHEEPAPETQSKSLDLETELPHAGEPEVEIHPRNLDELALHSEVANQDEPELDKQPKDLDSHLEQITMNEDPVVETPPKSPTLEAQPSHHDDSEAEIQPKNLDELSLHSDSDKLEADIQPKNLDSLPELDDSVAESQPKGLDVENDESSHHAVEIQPRNLDELPLDANSIEPEVDIQPKDLDNLPENISVHEDSITDSQLKSLDLASEEPSRSEVEIEPRTLDVTQLHSENDESEVEIKPKDLDSLQDPPFDHEDKVQSKNLDLDKEPEAELQPRNLDELPVQVDSPNTNGDNIEIEPKSLDVETKHFETALSNSEETEVQSQHEGHYVEIMPRDLDAETKDLEIETATPKATELEMQVKNLDELPTQVNSSDPEDNEIEKKPRDLHAETEPVPTPELTKNPESKHKGSDSEIQPTSHEVASEPEHGELGSELQAKNPDVTSGSVSEPDETEMRIQPKNLDELPQHSESADRLDKEHEEEGAADKGNEASDHDLANVQTEDGHVAANHPKEEEIDGTQEPIAAPFVEETKLAQTSTLDEPEPQAEVNATSETVAAHTDHIPSESSVNIVEVHSEEEHELPVLERLPEEADESIEPSKEHHDNGSVKSEAPDNIVDEKSQQDNHEHAASPTKHEDANSQVEIATEGNDSPQDHGLDTDALLEEELPIEVTSPTRDENTSRNLPEGEDSRAASPTGKHSMDSVRSLTEKDLFAMMSGSYKQPPIPEEEVSKQGHEEAVPEPKDLDQVSKEIDDTVEENVNVTTHDSSVPVEQTKKDDSSEDGVTSVKEDSKEIVDDTSFEPKDLDQPLATTNHDDTAATMEALEDIEDDESIETRDLDQTLASTSHDDTQGLDTHKEDRLLDDENSTNELTSEMIDGAKELSHDTPVSKMAAGIASDLGDAQDDSPEDPFSEKAEIEDASDAKVNEAEDHTRPKEPLAEGSPYSEDAKDQEALSGEVLTGEVNSDAQEAESRRDWPEPNNLDISKSDTPVHATSISAKEPNDENELAVKDITVAPEAVHSHSASLTDVEDDQISHDEKTSEEPNSAKDLDPSFEPKDLDQDVKGSEETTPSNDDTKSQAGTDSESPAISTHVEKAATNQNEREQDLPVSKELDPLEDATSLDSGSETSNPIESANPIILAANIEQGNIRHDYIDAEHPISKGMDTVLEPKDLDHTTAAKEIDIFDDEVKTQDPEAENLAAELESKNLDNFPEVSDSEDKLSGSPDVEDTMLASVESHGNPTSSPRELEDIADSEEMTKESSAQDESHNKAASHNLSTKAIDTLTEPNELDKLVEKTDTQTLPSENEDDQSSPDHLASETVPTKVIPQDLDASTDPKEHDRLFEKIDSQEKELDMEDVGDNHSAHSKSIDETASADVVSRDLDAVLEPSVVHEPVDERNVDEEDSILPSDDLGEDKSESATKSPEIGAKNLDILPKEDELEEHPRDSKSDDGVPEQNDMPDLKALNVSTEDDPTRTAIEESDVDKIEVASTPLEEAVKSLAVAQDKDTSTAEKSDSASPLPVIVLVESEPVSESDEESLSGSEAPSIETERFNALLEGHDDKNLENEPQKHSGPESDYEDDMETPAPNDTASKRLDGYHDSTASWVAANREEELVPHKHISESDVEESQKVEASDTHDFELESSTVPVPLLLNETLHEKTPQEPKEEPRLPVATNASTILSPEESHSEEFDSKTATPTREASLERPVTPAEGIGRALDFEPESPHTVGDANDLFDDEDSEDELPMRDEREFVHNGDPLSDAHITESAGGFDDYESPFQSHVAPNPNLFANLVNTIRPEIALVRQMSDIPESPENHLDDSDYVGNSYQPSEDQIAEDYDDEHDQFDQGHYSQNEDNYLRTRSHTADTDTVPSFETYAHSDEEDSPPGTPIDEIANLAQEALLNEHLISSSWPVRQNVDSQESEQDLKPQASPMQAEFDPFNPSQYGAYVTPKASRTELVTQKRPDSISEKIASAETMHSRPQSLTASQVQQFEEDMSSFRPKSLDASDSSPFSSPFSSNNPYARPGSRLSMDATPPLRTVSRLSIDSTRNRGTSSPTPPRSISRLSIDGPLKNNEVTLTPPPKSPRRSTVTSSSSPMSIFQKTRSLFESSNSTPLLPSIGLFRGGTSPKPQASPAGINRDRPGSLYHDILPPAISPKPSNLKHQEYDEEEDSMLVPRSLDPIPKPPSPTFTLGSRPNSLRSRNSNEDTQTPFYDNPETNNPYDGAGYGGSPSKGLESSVHNPRRTENTPLLNRRRGDDDDDGLIY